MDIRVPILNKVEETAMAAQEAVQLFLRLLVSLYREHKCTKLHTNRLKHDEKNTLASLALPATTATCLLAAFWAAFRQAAVVAFSVSLSLSFEEKLKGKAQAEGVERERGREVEPMRHATEPGCVVPTATTVHAARARRRTRWAIGSR